jgi:hypothetical protein
MEEPKEIPGFCTIDEIVSEVQNDIGDAADMGQHFRFAQWVIRGYGQLRQFALPVGKEALLPISAQTSTITIPDDFVEFGDIGINVEGQWWSFTLKPELVSTTTQNCGEETLESTHGEGEVLLENNPLLYGITGGVNPYYYKPDLKNHRIIVYANGLTECVLKYISTGISVGTETIIPIIAKEALIAWLHFQRVLNDRKSTPYDIEKRQAIWGSRLKELRIPRNLTAWYDILFSTIRNTPKR